MRFPVALAVSGKDRDIYAGGFSANSDNVLVPGYWKNGIWIGLPPLAAVGYSQVNSLVVSGGDVYASGFSTSTSGASVPGYWKNGTWVGLTQLAPARNPSAVSLVVSGADVYAGGYNTDSTNAGVPGYWKNGAWLGLTPPDGASTLPVLSLAVSGGDVYAGGVNPLSPDASLPGYWKNGTWVGLPSPDGARIAAVLPFLAPFYNISGNAGIPGAMLAYTDGTDKIAVADASGNYTFNVSPDWLGRVTPSKSGYTFTPASMPYLGVQADQTQDYTPTVEDK